MHACWLCKSTRTTDTRIFQLCQNQYSAAYCTSNVAGMPAHVAGLSVRYLLFVKRDELVLLLTWWVSTCCVQPVDFLKIIGCSGFGRKS